jgi:hypothetical protein
MKKLLFLLLIAAGCSSEDEYSGTTLPLAGEWGFRVD